MRLNILPLERLFGLLGSVCLLLIIPVKALRFLDGSIATSVLAGIAPSLLGPAGFLFLLLSRPGKSTRSAFPRMVLSVAVIALGLEFVQLLPRPGILAAFYYTFDWLDVLATLISLSVGSVASFLLMNTQSHEMNR